VLRGVAALLRLQTLLAKLLILATNLATGVITARSRLKGGRTSCDDSMATVGSTL